MSIIVSKENGKKKVKITNNNYGLEFFTMRNGFQWSGFDVDVELLQIMKEVIDEFLTNHTKE